MARVEFLADTSAIKRLHRPSVRVAFDLLSNPGRIALSQPVVYEVAHSARNRTEHRDLLEELDGFPQIPTTDADHHRAVEVQGLLARDARHRGVSLVDALVAATAEARDLTVLHYDADFDLIADVTGQSHRWIVERGSADG